MLKGYCTRTFKVTELVIPGWGHEKACKRSLGLWRGHELKVPVDGIRVEFLSTSVNRPHTSPLRTNPRASQWLSGSPSMKALTVEIAKASLGDSVGGRDGKILWEGCPWLIDIIVLFVDMCWLFLIIIIRPTLTVFTNRISSCWTCFACFSQQHGACPCSVETVWRWLRRWDGWERFHVRSTCLGLE